MPENQNDATVEPGTPGNAHSHACVICGEAVACEREHRVAEAQVEPVLALCGGCHLRALALAVLVGPERALAELARQRRRPEPPPVP
jgi:hypothetical protein